jgi:hypothetical protein
LKILVVTQQPRFQTLGVVAEDDSATCMYVWVVLMLE